MVEHVGVGNLPIYFRVALGALKPGGRFLMQGVTSTRHMPRTAALDWAQRYIFPDAELPYIAQYVEAASAAGFELRDAECMREHYALTHRHWRLNLEAARDEVVAEVGEERYRAMRAMFGFSTYHMLVGRRCEVYQLLLHAPIAGEVFAWRRPL
ncbi:MAG: class I SAM-dependent methyltransferase [Myxococcales bacterium]|nr:class I SAM-dependent methyltransferase [Myxococcales bacterium]